MKCQVTGEEVECCDGNCKQCVELEHYQPRRGIKKRERDDERKRRS
jgi:hypothetical protein